MYKELFKSIYGIGYIVYDRYYSLHFEIYNINFIKSYSTLINEP